MNKNIENLGISKTSKVLIIYPHPDDETYCNGGLIQKLVAQGIETKIVCLTQGGASTLAFTLNQNEKLTEVRKNEFLAVMNFLRVTNFNILNLEDGNLAGNVELLNELVKKEINSYKPTSIITYEPSGIYGHPDHIVVSDVVSRLAESSGVQLIYSTVESNYKSAESSLKMAANPNYIKPLKPTFFFSLSISEYINKVKAMQLYKSQISLKQDFFHKIYQAYKMRHECYVVCK